MAGLKSLVYSTNIHGTLAGSFLEIVILPERTQGPIPKKNAEGKTQGTETPESIEKRSARRAQRRIREIVNSNELFVLHTLTYAISHPKYFEGERPFVLIDIEKQRDRAAVIEHWSEFAKRMTAYARRKNIFFKYLCVIERHTGKRTKDNTVKTGTFHIHFVSDRIWPKRLLQHKWKHGFCNYADFRVGTKSRDMQDGYDGPPPDNPGAYMSKYIGKDASKQGEEEAKNKKRYWRNRELDKPVRVHGDEVKDLMRNDYDVVYNKKQRIEVDGREFSIEYLTVRLGRSPFAKLRAQKPRTPLEKRQRKALDRIAAIEVKELLQRKRKGERFDERTHTEYQDDINKLIEKKLRTHEEARKGHS